MTPRLFGLACFLATLASPRPDVGAEEWPHWRGVNRDAVTDEVSGWKVDGWTDGKPAWQVRVGEGASSPIVHDGVVYVIGWADELDTVTALDAKTGETIWSGSYPAPRYGRHAVGDQRMYRGATATPELDPESGRLFTLGCDGDLRAWDTRAGGQPLWNLNLYDRFQVPRRPQVTKRKNTLRDYGYTTSPLVWGDRVVVEVGSPEHGNLIAFDQATGEIAWASENRDPGGHSGGLAPVEIDGVPCVAVATSFGLHVARLDGAEAGKMVASFEWKTDFSNTIAGIAVAGRDVLISSRYNQMAMARVQLDLENGAREIWRNRYPTGVCTPVIHGGKIYFANKGVFCVDFASGDLDWAGGKVGDAGSCMVTGDDRLVVWANGGDLSLFETAERSPDRCLELGNLPGLFTDMAWPHVVLAEGRLFLKTLSGDLACVPVSP